MVLLVCAKRGKMPNLIWPKMVPFFRKLGPVSWVDVLKILAAAEQLVRFERVDERIERRDDLAQRDEVKRRRRQGSQENHCRRAIASNDLQVI